jgi:glycosyltransferase involved in cell wall biosynthesis
MPEVRVLSFSTNYPRPADKNRGLFVRARLQHMAQLLSVKVVSPVTLTDYAAHTRLKSLPPARTQDQNLEVFYPRWVYPPYGGFLNAWFLAARMIPFLRKLRREYPFDLIDSHFGHPEGIAAGIIGAALHLPFTITLRGNETMHAKAAGCRWWMRWAIRRASRIIAVAESLRQFAISMGADARLARTIPNGIDTGLFYSRGYTESRARLGIPMDRPAIVSAGYLIERKGHHRVVRALAELRKQGALAELWVVGGPGREGNFETQIHQEVRVHGLENAVHFAGVVDQATLAEYMSAADIFCLATSREGWPNVVHEALGCGAPVVATDVGGIQDMLPSADYGIVVPAGDQKALTAALGEGINRRWNRDAIAAWGGARSWTQVAAETADTLRAAVLDPLGRLAAA